MPPPNTKELTFRLNVAVDKTSAQKAQAELYRLQAGGSSFASDAAANISNPVYRQPRPTAGPDRPVPVVVTGFKAGAGGPVGANANALAILQNLSLGGVAGRIGQFQGYGAAATAAGAPRLGGFLGRAALPAALALGGLETAAGAAAAARDNFATPGLTLRALARLVPGGETLQRLGDSLTGRARGIEAAQIGGQFARLDVAARGQVEAFRGQFDPTQAGNVARAGAFGPPVLEPYVNRGTAAGEREFRQRQQLVALDRDTARYTREAKAATAERVEAETRLTRLRREERGLSGLRNTLGAEGAMTQYGSGPGYQQYLEFQGALGAGVSQTAQLRQQAEQNLYQARLREAAAQGQVSAQGAQAARVRAGFAEEDAGVASGTAQRLGRLGALGRAQGEDAFRQLEKFGPDLVPERIKSLAEGYAPQEAAKIYERYGGQSGEFRRGVASGGADFRGDPEQLRQEASRLRNEAERIQVEAEKKVADAAVAAGKNLGEAVADAIRRVVDEAKREILNNLRSGRNVNG